MSSPPILTYYHIGFEFKVKICDLASLRLYCSTPKKKKF